MIRVVSCRSVRLSANLIRDSTETISARCLPSSPSICIYIQPKREGSTSSLALDNKEGRLGFSSGKNSRECPTIRSYPLHCAYMNALLGMLEKKPYFSRMHMCESSLKLYTTKAGSAEGEGIEGPVVVDYSSLLSEKDFHEIADRILEHVQERIEEYGEEFVIDEFDIDYAEGVLTIRLGSLGTYVINKQTPNRQIWLSSPVSGPARFDWQGDEKSWVYRRTKAELLSLLQKELSELLKTDIDLTI